MAEHQTSTQKIAAIESELGLDQSFELKDPRWEPIQQSPIEPITEDDYENHELFRT